MCLYPHLSYLACKSHLFCATLGCHMWPVWFYRTVTQCVACLALPYCYTMCGLSRCTVLLHNVWPVSLYLTVTQCVACVALPYCYTMCSLSRSTVLLHNVWPVSLYRTVTQCVACLALPYCYTISHKWCNFQQLFIEYKMYVLIFSTASVWNIAHSKKNLGRYYHKITPVFM
jgi:hypothetical protein